MNYLKVLEDLLNLSEAGVVTEKVILKIHKLLTKDVIDNPADCGVYRNRQVVIGNRITGVITLNVKMGTGTFILPIFSMAGRKQFELEHLTDEQINDVLDELKASATHLYTHSSMVYGRAGHGVKAYYSIL